MKLNFEQQNKDKESDQGIPSTKELFTKISTIENLPVVGNQNNNDKKIVEIKKKIIESSEVKNSKKIYYESSHNKMEINLDDIEVETGHPTKLESGQKAHRIFTIKNKGKIIGNVRILMSKDGAQIEESIIYGYKNKQPNVLLKVFNKIMKTVGLPEVTKTEYLNTGKGIGVESYKKIDKWLWENNRIHLISDTRRSIYANRLWKSLEKKGLAEKQGKHYIFKQ